MKKILIALFLLGISCNSYSGSLLGLKEKLYHEKTGFCFSPKLIFKTYHEVYQDRWVGLREVNRAVIETKFISSGGLEAFIIFDNNMSRFQDYRTSLINYKLTYEPPIKYLNGLKFVFIQAISKNLWQLGAEITF